MKKYFLLLTLLFLSTQLSAQTKPSKSLLLATPEVCVASIGGIASDTIFWQFLSTDTTTQLQPLQGNLTMSFPGWRTAEEYEHRLDSTRHVIEKHIITAGIDMQQKLCVYEKRKVFIVHYQVSDESQPLNFRIALNAEHQGTDSTTVHMQSIRKTFCDPTSCSEVLLYVKTDDEGASVHDRDGIRIIDARKVTLYLTADQRALPIKNANAPLETRTPPIARRLHRDLSIRLHRTLLKPLKKFF
ncbi:MAG: glycoside hydrolase N-terminal domain-containing protein [Bacteroidaceae bacterium]|nr:glycoside hydrolase N-terminal domain-containing protein [Bacteroidaceae bacterium]